MKNDDAYNDWEYEKRRAIEFFQKFDKTLLEVREQIEKRNEELDNLFLNIDKEKGKSIDDVFIDNLIDYGSKQTNKTLLTSLDEVYKRAKQQEKTFSKLPSDQQKIIQKRLAELEQLVDRGQRMEKAGYTDEYIDTILRLTYDMSKDGLREAVSFDISSIATDFGSGKALGKDQWGLVNQDSIISKLGWFQSSNYNKDNPVILNGKEFRSFTEYVASKLSPEEFNKIEEINRKQGYDSYSEQSTERKFAVLKSMGFDVNDYKSWSEMYNKVSSEGFFIGPAPGGYGSSEMELSFKRLKKKADLFDTVCKGQSVFDAAIQLVLENTDFTGNYRDSKTMILIRTEKSKVIPQGKEGNNINGETVSPGVKFFPGVCESHSHINASVVTGDCLTAVRVPYSRIHSLWFMEYGEMKSSGYETDKDKPFQFWAHHQNEVDACTKDLPIIYIGKTTKIKKTRQEAVAKLQSWEGTNTK